MNLTDAQKKINEDSNYWKWFEQWWEQDFSWMGLKNKKTPNGIPLQGHYNRNSGNLVNRFGRDWHPVNAPYHDKDGNLVHDNSSLISWARDTLNNLRENVYIGVLKPPNTFTHKQGYSHYWSKSSSFNFSTTRVGSIKNCLVDVAGGIDSRVFNNSIITVASPTRATSQGVFTFNDCTFSTASQLNGRHDASVILNDCTFQNAVIIRFNIISIENIKTSSIDIHPVESGLQDVSNFNLKLNMNKTHAAAINIIHRKKSDKKVTQAVAEISLGSKQELYVSNINFHTLKLGNKSMKTLEIDNCNFASKLKLIEAKIINLKIYNSTFKRGINAENATFNRTARLQGVRLYNSSNFSETKFMAGVSWKPIDQGSNEGAISVIENANFEKAKFIDPAKSLVSSAVNFNDTKFVGSANFDDVTFDGIPKFHGSELHSETSFRNMKPIPDLEEDNKIENNEVYNHYNAAFRTLRQHMEKNNNFPTAFFFGRLEMIAKEKRGATRDVPITEICFTKWYGALADYGQNFILPLKFLFWAWFISLGYQFFTFITTSSKCFIWSDNCELNRSLVGEAFERGTTFSLPPFTMLTNRSIDDNTELELSWITDILSGLGMVGHAVAASLLLFLFALSVKRKMQIK